ncbi:hypothetical protein [Burkholderia ubonensis]|uniref:hypothetical protein n=1 Tax=Burkholderia ubonensis TaxID=101571 RepID=UPI000AF9C4EB|nr:hypothetical protein [Burkholderia ubonensis]
MKTSASISANTATTAATTFSEKIDTFVQLTTTTSDQSPYEAFTPISSLGATGSGTFAITSSQASYAVANSILGTMRKPTSTNK